MKIVGTREALFCVCLGLLAGGLWPVYPPVAAIVPGEVLVGVVALACFSGRSSCWIFHSLSFSFGSSGTVCEVS